MSKARIMSAGTVGTSKRVRVNGPEGGGNALQGLPPICNMRSALVPYVRTRADGENRNVVFCVNQLGGIGAKRGQFGPGNRSGVGQTGGCADEPFKIPGSLLTPPPSFDDLFDDWDLNNDSDLSVGELINSNPAYYLFSDELDSDSDGIVRKNEYNRWLSERNDSAYLGSTTFDRSYSIIPPQAEDWKGWEIAIDKTSGKKNYKMRANPWATSVVLKLVDDDSGDIVKVKLSMSMPRMNYMAAEKTYEALMSGGWREAWTYMGSLGYNFQIGSHSGSEGVFPLGTMLPNFFNQAGKQAFKPNANFHLQFSKIEGENYPGTLASILKSANIIDDDGNIIDNPTQFGIGFHKAPPYIDPDTDDKYRAVTGWAAGQPDSVSGPRKGWDKAEGWSSEGTLVYHIHCSNSKKSGRDWRFELLDKGRKIEFANQPGFYCAALQINGNWYKPDISLQAYKDGDIGNGWFALARCDSFYMYHVSDKYFDDARDRRCVKMCAPSGCLACMCAKPKFGCITNHKLP